jgi:hypothetical protein
MYSQNKKIQALYFMLIVAAYFLSPVSFDSVDGGVVIIARQVDAGASLADSDANSPGSRINVIFSQAEAVNPQEDRGGLRTQEIGKTPCAALLGGFLHKNISILTNAYSNNTFPWLTFSRHVIIPHSTHAPPSV